MIVFVIRCKLPSKCLDNGCRNVDINQLRILEADLSQWSREQLGDFKVKVYFQLLPTEQEAQNFCASLFCFLSALFYASCSFRDVEIAIMLGIHT